MSKFKRKKNQIGVDKFGLTIYKRDLCTCVHEASQHNLKGKCSIEDCSCKGAYHHSSATLEQYVICDGHICEVHGKWSHKMVPNMECKLSVLNLDYVPCEECITFGLNVTREEKIKMMSKSQQNIIEAWKKLKENKK